MYNLERFVINCEIDNKDNGIIVLPLVTQRGFSESAARMNLVNIVRKTHLVIPEALRRIEAFCITFNINWYTIFFRERALRRCR